MTAIASTDVTVVVDPHDRHVLGKLRMSIGTISFGDGALTYPAGGVEMPAIGNFGMNKEITALDIIDTGGLGYQLSYDHTDRTLKMLTQAPPIVYEEAHTVPATPFAITLNYPAAAILNVASATVGYDFIEASDTLAAGEVQLTSAMAEGVRTGLTFHSEVGAVKVTYITQAWEEVWRNRVAATAVTTEIGRASCRERV